MLENKKCPRCDGKGVTLEMWCNDSMTGVIFHPSTCKMCGGNKKIQVDDNSTDRKIQAILKKFYEERKTQSASQAKDIFKKKVEMAAEDDDES